MPAQAIIFYTLAALILGSAVMVVAARNAIGSAIALVVTLLGVGALYLTAHAEFLFAVQVLVYTGGIMVLFLFVIMLVNEDEAAHVRRSIKRWYLPAATALAVFAALAWKAWETASLAAAGDPAKPAGGNTRAVATELMVNYLLPFEVLSILLLVAMVGAIVLSKKEV